MFYLSCKHHLSATGLRDVAVGSIIQYGVDFISEIGRMLEQVYGNARECCFLFLCLSVTVQRFNSRRLEAVSS